MRSTVPLEHFDSGDIYRWQKDLIYYHFTFSGLNKTFGQACAWGILPKRDGDAEALAAQPGCGAAAATRQSAARHPRLGQRHRGEAGPQAGKGKMEKKGLADEMR